MQQIVKFPIKDNEMQLSRLTRAGSFCEVVGQKSAALGYEQGIFEIWVYPFKILHELQLSFFIEKYNQTIKGTDIANQIIVRPELITIVYCSELFTVRQHLLAPIHDSGVIILLDIMTYCPITVVFSFIPDLVPMWPAGLGGQFTLWLDDQHVYYIGEGSRTYVGLVGAPLTKPQTSTPGHQLPETAMKLSFNISPEMAQTQYFPLIIAASIKGKDDAITTYQNLLNNIQQLYQTTYQHYQRLSNNFLSIQSPDTELNFIFEWAKVALDKGFVDNPNLGKGLVAGYGIAGDSQRPGFAWFFGGDAFINSFALNGYGDFETVKQTLTFFRNHQRQDGKIPHECTQSAALINWFEDYPYAFYHADTTPYFIVAVYNYVVSSGDELFLKQNWQAIVKAFYFCIRADTDDDGLMENSAAGLAAMEVGTMLSKIKVDIYLASIWIKALQCMDELAQIVNDVNIQSQSKEMLAKATSSFQKIFINSNNKSIKFALLEDGNIISDVTVWQSIPFFCNIITEDQAKTTLDDLACSGMSTDWGVRSVSMESQHYDPISYNTGSVWPFTTGYVAVAEYFYHRQINGFTHLMQNARLTRLDALGWHPELLSSEFYCPISTAVPHQLFSASGIINPLIWGLLGLSGNAIKKEIIFAPHLPLSWDKLIVKNYRLGDDTFDFQLYKNDNSLKLQVNHQGKNKFSFTFSPALGITSTIKNVTVDKQQAKYNLLITRYDTHCPVTTSMKNKLTIDLSYQSGIELELPEIVPKMGDCSLGLKLIDYHIEGKIFTVIFEGVTGMSYRFKLRTRFKIESIEGAKIIKDSGLDKEVELNFNEEKKKIFKKKVVQFVLG